MGLFSKLFNSGGRDKLKVYLDNNAVIIDVRTPEEFGEGHVNGAMNIPLGSIEEHVEDIIGFNRLVVLCCASGMRSSKATKILKRHGVDCINGGGWTNVGRALA
ncbi:MAG: rhodanese-like domain-containing protein [Bacteroidota bacterium]